MRRIEKLPTKYRREIKGELDRLADLIQLKRKALGFTQEDLAEHLDISVNGLKSIEQKIRFPSLPMLFYICRVLKITIRFE